MNNHQLYKKWEPKTLVGALLGDVVLISKTFAPQKERKQHKCPDKHGRASPGLTVFHLLLFIFLARPVFHLLTPTEVIWKTTFVLMRWNNYWSFPFLVSGDDKGQRPLAWQIRRHISKGLWELTVSHITVKPCQKYRMHSTPEMYF